MRFGSCVLAGVCVVMVGCGGSGAEPAASGGTPSSSGGQTTTGGAASTTGGAASGGTSTAGAASGGSAGNTGGSSNGGAGSGGVATGGDSTGGMSGGGVGSFGNGGCEGVTKSDQAPGTWEQVIHHDLVGGEDAYVSGISVDPARPCDVYIYADWYGCWRSSDYGATWGQVDDELSGHGAWYAAIERNPSRDPATSPDIYVAAGYSENGIWKSTDFGETFVDVWNNNIFAEDGVTNIYNDVGRDVFAIHALDDPDHLIADLHSYGGDQGNNGVFETTNGGQTWVVKKTSFGFSPHSEVMFWMNPTTWLVNSDESGDWSMWRTTDSGETWNDTGSHVTRGTGFIWTWVGSTMYASSDAGSGRLYKTTDVGATWTLVANSPNKAAGIVSSEKFIYLVSGYDWDPPELYRASVDDDTNWTKLETPAGMFNGGHDMDITYDGEHYIILAPMHRAGMWRYVEE